MAQTFDDFEFLLCDDGTTDSSTATARSWEARFPGKVRYLEHPGHANRGMSATRNLGIATATPRGLMVPNLPDADQLDLFGLARALERLTATAREGRATPADLTGGTISITNVGMFGIDCGTPIINPGEAAILCLGAIRQQPWVHEGAVAVRWVTTLGLSFDHRLVDGEQGSRFLADIADTLGRA